MAKRKVTVTVDEELVEAARLESESLSAIVNAAMASEIDRRGRRAALGRLLEQWDNDFGVVDDEAAALAVGAFDDLDGHESTQEVA